MLSLHILGEGVGLDLEKFDLILPLLILITHISDLILQKHHFLFKQCIVSFLITLSSEQFIVQISN